MPPYTARLATPSDDGDRPNPQHIGTELFNPSIAHQHYCSSNLVHRTPYQWPCNKHAIVSAASRHLCAGKAPLAACFGRFPFVLRVIAASVSTGGAGPTKMDIPQPLLHCYRRTLRIETPRGSSSSFVMNHNGQQWLVTAAHVVDGIRTDDIEVHDQTGESHSGLQRLPTMATSHEDVAVFRLWTKDADFGPPLEPHVPDDVFATQDAYFLGFPDLGDGLTYAHPTTPFIKIAIVSGQATDHDGTMVWLLDGIVSGGFSGGPLIIHEQESGGYRVFAVVCCYVSAKLAVLGPSSIPTPESESESEPRGFVQANSGLVIGFDIRHAVDAIDKWG
jgi:hypothetical protein